jgi:alpha-beta hydrolase superfamily lysophospholipase
MTEFQRIPLHTGVTLNVAVAGEPAKPAVILLHGFPESHRTWRELAPRLQEHFYLIMPDQRGFGGSDLPQDVDSYRPDTLIDDLPMRFDSEASPSSGTTGGARSPGARLCAAMHGCCASRSSTRRTRPSSRGV